MRIMLIIMADIFVLITAIVAVYEFYGLKRYNSFTVPYTDKMISLGIIDPEKRDSLLLEEKLGHYIGIALATVCAGMLSVFIAKFSGAIVYIAAFAGLMLYLHPEMNETTATRNGYFKSHRAIMDIRKYHDYLVSVGDIKESETPVQ